MIEAFERHLKEHQFQKQFDKLETVEDRIKFCEDYLAKHKPEPEFPIAKWPDDGIVNTSGLSIGMPTATFPNTLNEATVLTNMHIVSSTDIMNKPLNVIEKEIERMAIMKLMGELISKGYVKLQRLNDPYKSSITYTMKLGVYKA